MGKVFPDKGKADVALAPSDITDDAIADAVSQALWRHKPSGSLFGWYLEIAEAVGSDPKTVENWARGKHKPGSAYVWRLIAHLGPRFALEIHENLTGQACELRQLACDAAALKAIEGKAVEIIEAVEKARGPDDAADRRSA